MYFDCSSLEGWLYTESKISLQRASPRPPYHGSAWKWSGCRNRPHVYVVFSIAGKFSIDGGLSSSDQLREIMVEGIERLAAVPYQLNQLRLGRDERLVELSIR